MATKGISWQKNPFGNIIHYDRIEVQSTRIIPNPISVTTQTQIPILQPWPAC